MEESVKVIEFPFEQDCLYVRGNNPSNYLLIHNGDEEGSNFLAYFESLLSNIPVIYDFKTFSIFPYADYEKDSANEPQECPYPKCLTGNEWTLLTMKDTIFPGGWNQVLNAIREELIIKNKEKKNGSE